MRSPRFDATTVVTIVLAVSLLAACSTLRNVSGEAPLAGIDGVELRGDEVVVELALRNINDVPMRLSAIELELELDGEPLADTRRDLDLQISARGREVIALSARPAAGGRNRLDAMARGEVFSLPWTLNVTLYNEDKRFQRAQAEGWLHPVPGQANHFR